MSELAAIFRQRQSQRDKSSGGGDRVRRGQREGSGAALMDGEDPNLFFGGRNSLTRWIRPENPDQLELEEPHIIAQESSKSMIND